MARSELGRQPVVFDPVAALGVLDGNGVVVGQLAHGFAAPPGADRVHASLLAVVSWDSESSEPQYRQGLRIDAWEVVVPAMVVGPQA